MSQETIETTVARRLNDDYDVLLFAKNLDSKLKANDWFFSRVYSEVNRVDDGFYITPDLKIAVASIRHLKERGVPDDINILRDIYYGGLSHENAHAISFPFMTRMNLTYAVVYGYCKERGIKLRQGLFDTVENIISDIFNELIIYTHKLEGYKELPVLRYYYVFRPAKDLYEKTPRQKLEKNPVNAVFATHNIVFASLFLNKIKMPKVPLTQWLSEHIYNAMYDVASTFRIREHMELLLSGGFTNVINTLVNYYDMYSAIDDFYNKIRSLVESERVQISDAEFADLRQILFNKNLGRDTEQQYWFYYIFLTAMYRYIVEHPDLFEQIKALPNVDTGKHRPAPPSPDILDDVLNQLRGNTEILSPEIADYVAKRLLSTALLTPRDNIETLYTVGTTKVPWYRRPRGKIDPQSLLKPSILDWRVVVQQNIPEQRAKTFDITGAPDRITVVIDESGSTTTRTSILAPIIGIDTSVFDVERVSIMSLLYNVLRYTDETKTTLIRFSSHTVVEEGTVKSIYDRLKTLKSNELMWGGTNIEEAVAHAVENHVDKPTNYFLLATDMEITPQQAANTRNIILSRVRRSPVLILAVNADIPGELVSLNRYPNVAVVSVKNMSDYPKLEEAIKKLVLILK
mgnify:CR=1 FL=1